MNYLAHLFLARGDEQALIGALLGDFVKGRSAEQYRPAVRRGILLHRQIDRYTDAHALVRASRALVSPERRRFAGIMMDVFYDHFLARHWQRYADVALGDFSREVYAILLRRQREFPERLQAIVPRMVSNDWLGRYRELDGIAVAVDGISRRLRRPNTLAGAASELTANYARVQGYFLAFFPQLMAFVQHCERDGHQLGDARAPVPVNRERAPRGAQA